LDGHSFAPLGHGAHGFEFHSGH